MKRRPREWHSLVAPKLNLVYASFSKEANALETVKIMRRNKVKVELVRVREVPKPKRRKRK